jgi:hypothetical protein
VTTWENTVFFSFFACTSFEQREHVNQKNKYLKDDEWQLLVTSHHVCESERDIVHEYQQCEEHS